MSIKNPFPPNFEDIEDIFDRLEAAEIEESPLGLTILGMTEADWRVMKAIYGRSNGIYNPRNRTPVIVQIIDETVYAPKKTLFQKIKDWFNK